MIKLQKGKKMTDATHSGILEVCCCICDKSEYSAVALPGKYVCDHCWNKEKQREVIE